MKKMLKKILFISLLFSATVPATMQASFFSWAALKNSATKIGSKAVNWLSANGGNALNFLKKHPIAVGGTIVVTVAAWKLSKILRQRKLNNNLWEAIKEGDADKPKGNYLKAKETLESGAKTNQVNQQGQTPLMEAAWHGNAKIVELLIDNEAELNKQNKHGSTALMIASELGHFQVTKSLLKNEATIDLQDKHGQTALILAVQCDCKDHLKVVELLLEHRADPSYIKNNDGKNAFDLIFSDWPVTEHQKEEFKQNMLAIIKNRN